LAVARFAAAFLLISKHRKKVTVSQQVELGVLGLDIEKVIRQLRQDLKDDWYPDSLAYHDALKVDVAADCLESTFEKNHGLFVPEGRTELNIPKKGFVLRYSLEMSFPDRLYYHALVADLIPFYDPILPPQVLNHRYAVIGNRAGRYLFKHPVEQWQLFRGYVIQEIQQYPVILITDIQNYYENIEVDRVLTVLKENLPLVSADGVEKARIRRIIEELRRCLRLWCYKPTHGLPQNRDASSFLASMLLSPVDRAMLDEGYQYYRYMDDIRIAVKTKYQARAALQSLTTQLRRFGLNLNPAKTHIWEPSDKGYEDALGKEEPLLAEIDSMWRSRSLPVIRRSFEPLRRLAADLIERRATQERSFRFCIHKLANLARCPEIDVPTSFFDPMTDVCIQELDEQPYSSDQMVNYLKAVPTSEEQISRVAGLLRDNARSLYDWQNYLLWQLMVYKEYKSSALMNVARVRAERVDRPADRAGAMLYLGAMGTTNDRLLVARLFESCGQHIVQRNALIAVHEIEFHSGIEQHVANHVSESLRGTYKRLRKGYLGHYYQPLPPISAVDIYDEVSSYD
jgi:hypothetical protein